MPQHRRIGRNEKREYERQIAELEGRLQMQRAINDGNLSHYQTSIEDERKATRTVQERLRWLESEIRKHVAASTLLKPTTLIDRDHTRVPIRQELAATLYQETNIDRYQSMPIEHVMMLMLNDEKCRTSLARRLHFSIVNPPHQPGSALAIGYAVTHHEIALMHKRGRNSFTAMICEQFGHAIYSALFGKDAR